MRSTVVTYSHQHSISAVRSLYILQKIIFVLKLHYASFQVINNMGVMIDLEMKNSLRLALIYIVHLELSTTLEYLSPISIPK